MAKQTGFIRFWLGVIIFIGSSLYLLLQVMLNFYYSQMNPPVLIMPGLGFPLAISGILAALILIASGLRLSAGHKHP